MLFDAPNSSEMISLAKASVYTDDLRPSRVQDRTDYTAFNAENAIEPMYNPKVWSALLNQSSRLSRAVRVLARNTVGLGFYVSSRTPLDEMSPAEQEQFKRESEALEQLFDSPNPEQSTPELFECLKIDEEATGDWWMEVVRDRSGKIAGLYHAPSTTMRIAVDGRHFLQSRAGGKNLIHFTSFGDKRVLDPRTGKEAALPWDKRASEVIHRRIYTPDDDWYGAPRFVPAAAAISSTRLSQMWNINFLRNSAHSPYAVIVEGGNLNHESKELIRAFVNREGKGVANAGRVLLLEPELDHTPATMRNGVKIRLEKISVGLADDGSFLKLREADNEEIREVLGTAKILLGTFTDTNKSNATIALRVTVQQEIEPDIARKEHTINHTIVKDMGIKLAKFRFKRPKILDPLQDASLIMKLMTAFSVNDLREALSELRSTHMPPMDHPLARVPMAFFKDPKMLASAEALVESVVERTRELSEDPPEVGAGEAAPNVSPLFPELVAGE